MASPTDWVILTPDLAVCEETYAASRTCTRSGDIKDFALMQGLGPPPPPRELASKLLQGSHLVLPQGGFWGGCFQNVLPKRGT